MGLLIPIAPIILREHRLKNITGRVLFIGRQTVPMTPERAVRLLQEEGVDVIPGFVPELDSLTRGGVDKGFILDSSFFKLFSRAQFSTLDVSAYEGADILWNLNDPIPDHLEGQFDFIYNGSCLDNVFDAANSMRNLTRLLKVGGRILHLEHGSQVNNPYLMFPPDWFYDYYVVNRFADCRVFVAEFTRYDGSFVVTPWNPVQAIGDRVAVDWRVKRMRRDFFVITIAEKSVDSMWCKSPVQYQYRSSEQKDEYAKLAARFRASTAHTTTPSASQSYLSAFIRRIPKRYYSRLAALHSWLPLPIRKMLDPSGRGFSKPLRAYGASSYIEN